MMVHDDAILHAVEDAGRLLQGLDPEHRIFTFQPYDDWNLGRSWKPLHGSLEDLTTTLLDLNRQGAAIAVSINETDGTGRKTENIKRVRALWVDGDGLSLDAIRNCQLKPHLVVESSPGNYHAYWLVADCPREVFSQIQDALADHFGVDSSVKDLAHAMRMPGFRHQKNQNRPFLSRIVDGVGDPNRPRYSLRQIIDGLRLVPRAAKEPSQSTGSGDSAAGMSEWTNNIWDGKLLHNSCRDIAASLVRQGVPGGTVVNHLRVLMERSQARKERLQKWQLRYNEIPGLVSEAEEKFPPVPLEDRPSAAHGAQQAEKLLAKAEATSAREGEEPRPPPFELVPLLGHIAQAAPTFVWHTRVPRRVVTLWSSHGGFGKTTIAQMLSICCPLGLPLFGSPTEQCNVVYFSAEDEGGLMQHRLHHLCSCMGVDPALLIDKLFILDATSADDPALFVEVTATGRKIGITTEAYSQLREFMRDRNVGLLIIDNASDVFDANEIERARVRAFMRSLIKLAREFDMAVVLLAHVDKKSARGEAGGSDSYSGSTAWHNSARSRLALQKNKAGALVLVHEKWSLTTQQPDLTLTWPVDGIPTLADSNASTAARTFVDRMNLKALLKLIHQHTAEGKYVTPSNNSRSAAAVVLKGKDGYPAALDSVSVEHLLKEALADGYLRIDPHKSADGHRNGGKHWALTPSGLELAGITTAEVGSGK